MCASRQYVGAQVALEAMIICYIGTVQERWIQ